MYTARWGGYGGGGGGCKGGGGGGGFIGKLIVVAFTYQGSVP